MTTSTRARLAPILLVTSAALLVGASSVVGAPKEEPAPSPPAAAQKSKPAKSIAPGKPAVAVGQPLSPAKSAVAQSSQASSKPKTDKPGPAPKEAMAKPKPNKQVPLPRARPAAATAAAMARTFAAAVPMAIPLAATAEIVSASTPTPAAYAPAGSPGGNDVELVKDALKLARAGKTSAADERKAQIRDSAAQKLVEWTILRTDSTEATFARYAAFITANPNWPSVATLRRRAESQIWQERREAGTVFAFFSKHEPLTARGKLAVARALLTEGDRAGAQRYAREAWRQDAFSPELEAQVLESFGELLSRDDHKARMDRRLYADDPEAGMRAARRLGGNEPAVAQARTAVMRKASNAGALLDAVPSEARSDPGYIFARAQWLRRNDKIAEAGQLMLSASRDPEAIHDTNEWWVERRLIARKLLDADQLQAAYRVARDAARPEKSNYRTEQPFTAGWIALRFLDDPATAMKHFAEITHGTRNPIALARAGYWQGRAAEAMGRADEARRHYEAAARYPTAYYGQLARARIGQHEISVRRPELSEGQRLSARQHDVVRALELLYATDNRDLVIPFVADLAERGSDPAALALMGEITARYNDARAMLLIGKGALSHGYAFDQFAFPNIGMPKFAAIGPAIDRSVVYSIARQESAFNQKVVSIAKAMGLMQVTPAAGRYIAKKFGVTYHEKKLLDDPVYNTQMGAAEIGELVQAYDGNYAMAFAAYNAGRGRVKEWVERYGDPRKPDVDPVDWVERIPFSETRNYVQRVMENMQIYRARFGNGGPLTIEADLRGNRTQ